MTADKHAKRAARQHAEREGISYTAARRHLTDRQTQDAPAPVALRQREDFGGHTFDYQPEDDLFRCSECHAYEVVARADDGSITPCPGLVGWDGDTERVYLLVTVTDELRASGWDGWVTSLAWRVRKTGIGRSVGYGWRDGQLLFESAPGVVDELERRITQITLDLFGRQVPAAASVQRLTVEAGRAFTAENRAAYVAEYGESDD